jgi:hypothetical protein
MSQEMLYQTELRRSRTIIPGNIPEKYPTVHSYRYLHGLAWVPKEGNT